ncbi:hypothetical protein Sjap_004554 [Stephania japonica]|uniref:GATA transcription factor n=1 Tax=Stephania japonica TaxID=461633 RepID=A0AAP0K2Q2_9MAGN
MGKQGPCYHCGVTSTPLWRNGPPEKPVLCNACGSRWRTKGTLANYTPLHARAEPDDFEEYKYPKVKNISIKNKETKLNKRKMNHDNVKFEGVAVEFDHNFGKALEEDTSNRSSSGSAISYSESCVQFGGMDASELTGSAQSVVWDSLVPSRKRTCVNRPKASSVEKLTRDLCSILQEQSSYFSGSSEEDLLFDNENPMVSVEIGHGSILMKHPNSVSREEESEASSFSIDNKSTVVNDVYSSSASLSVHIDHKGLQYPSVSMDKTKRPMDLGTRQEHVKGIKFCDEKLQFLRNRDSLLRFIDLNDVVSFEEFVRHFTPEEQLQLMKYLPSTDTARLPDSLKNMFESRQFAENLSCFQKLLAEGVFDLSFVEDTEECKTLKKHTLVNLTKSVWVEQYNLLKDLKNKRNAGGKGIVGHDVLASSNSFSGKGPRNGQHNFAEAKVIMKSPKRIVVKASYDSKDVVDSDGSCFSPRSLFAFPPDHSSLMLDSLQFTDDSTDQDLLLDVPSNGSFPQAELLYPSFRSQQASASSSVGHPHFVHP